MKSSRGFTLIELLVVISILGLLSSIALASLKSARMRAKDTLIISQVVQLRNLLLLEHTDTGSFAGVSPAIWVQAATGGGASCDNVFGNATPYTAKANEICKVIYNNSENDPITGGAYVGSRLFVGINTNTSYPPVFDYTRSFSIMAYLPHAARWLCVGSSGQSRMVWPTSGSVNPPAASWTSQGCLNNP